MGGINKLSGFVNTETPISDDEQGNLAGATTFDKLLDGQEQRNLSAFKPILLAQNNVPGQGTPSLQGRKPPHETSSRGPLKSATEHSKASIRQAQVQAGPKASDNIAPANRAGINKWVEQNESSGFTQSLHSLLGDTKEKRLTDIMIASHWDQGGHNIGELKPAEKSLLFSETIAKWAADGDNATVENFGKLIGEHGVIGVSAGRQLADLSTVGVAAHFSKPRDIEAQNFASATALAATYAVAGAGDQPNLSALRTVVEGLGPQKAALFADALAAGAKYDPDAASMLGKTLTALNQGPETASSQQFTLHAFAGVSADTYRNTTTTEFAVVDIGASEVAAPMAAAVSRLMHPGDTKAQATETQRLTSLMASKEGVKLFAPSFGSLFSTPSPESEQASIALRMRAFQVLQAHPDISADNILQGGSPWLSRPLTLPLAEKGAQTMLDLRGDTAIAYVGTHLDDTIGTAMHLTPDRAPPNETQQQRTARETASAQGRYSNFDQEPVNLVRDAIRDADRAMGGNGTAPKITVLPIQVSTADRGPVELPLFRVDRDVDGKVQSQFVDNTGARFTSFDDWRQRNALPDGVMSFPDQGHLTADASGKVQLKVEDTPETHNTWHHVRGYLDTGLLVGGIVAGTCLTFGVGGVLITSVAVGAGIYGTARAGENLSEMSSRNQSLNPLASSEARANWLSGAAGLFGSAGMAVGTVSRTAAEAGTLARVATAVGPTTRVLGVGSDAAAIVNQMRDTALHWDQMSPSDRIMAGLNFAFWGVSAGAQVRDMYNFRAQQRLLTGTPPEGGGQTVGTRTTHEGVDDLTAAHVSAVGAVKSEGRGGQILRGVQRADPGHPLAKPEGQRSTHKTEVSMGSAPKAGTTSAEPRGKAPQHAEQGQVGPNNTKRDTPHQPIVPARESPIIKDGSPLGPEEIETIANLARQGGGTPLLDILEGTGLKTDTRAPNINVGGHSLHPDDAHRHEGVNSGTYDRTFMHTNQDRLVQMSRQGAVRTYDFPVSPHLFDRGSVSHNPQYYLERLVTPNGLQNVIGEAIVKNNTVEVRRTMLDVNGNETIKKGRYKLADFEAILGTKLKPSETTIRFVTSPRDVTLAYPGRSVDTESLGLKARQIAKELNGPGRDSPTSENQYHGLVGGNPYDPAAYRNAYDSFAEANAIEKAERIPLGSLPIAGYGEITISKEMVQQLSGMPNFAEVGQPGINALSQFLSPMRYNRGITIIHCDAGQPKPVLALRPHDPTTTHIVQGESDLSNVPNLVKLFQQNPDQQFIWAHAGASYTTTMPTDYLKTLRHVLESAPNVKIDLSWDVTSRWIQGNEAFQSRNGVAYFPNVRDTQRLNEWAQLLKEYPGRFLWGSDTVGASQTPGVNRPMEVFHQLEENGFIDALRPGGVYEQFLKANFTSTIVESRNRVTEWRTDPDIIKWLEKGGPSAENGMIPPKQFVENNDGTWRLKSTADLGPAGNRDTQIMPSGARPIEGRAVIYVKDAAGRYTLQRTERNPLEMGPINPTRSQK